MYNYFQSPYLYGQSQAQFPQLAQPQQPTLFGKMVENIDIAKSCEVPIGMTYFFPKADGTAIYSKGWLENGTTIIKEYKVTEDKAPKVVTLDDKLAEINTAINLLGKKIDGLERGDKSSPIPMKKKVSSKGGSEE